MEAWLFEAVAGVVIEIECLNEMIATQDALLKSMLDADPIAQRFEQVRGIGILTALMFKSVVEDPTRFESARHVASYLGLVPRERSSGEKRHLGGITKTGDTLTRSYLLQAAWSIMKNSAPSSPMKEWALRIAERRGKQKAATALARKLSRVLFALWRDGTSFTQPDSGAAAVEDVA